MSITFKLRAECGWDVLQLQHLLGDRAEAWRIEPTSPGCEAVFVCTMSLESIRRAARCVPDGHVMAETVAEAAKYTGERVGVAEAAS